MPAGPLACPDGHRGATRGRFPAPRERTSGLGARRPWPSWLPPIDREQRRGRTARRSSAGRRPICPGRRAGVAPGRTEQDNDINAVTRAAARQIAVRVAAWRERRQRRVATIFDSTSLPVWWTFSVFFFFFWCPLEDLDAGDGRFSRPLTFQKDDCMVAVVAAVAQRQGPTPGVERIPKPSARGACAIECRCPKGDDTSRPAARRRVAPAPPRPRYQLVWRQPPLRFPPRTPQNSLV